MVFMFFSGFRRLNGIERHMKNSRLSCLKGGRFEKPKKNVKNRIFRSNAGLEPEVAGNENIQKAKRNVQAKFQNDWDSIDHASCKVVRVTGQNRNFRLIQNRNRKCPVAKMSG